MRNTKTNLNFLATGGLLIAAISWGIIWYPYRLLQEAGINVSRSLVGNYTTALDMAGASVTVSLLDDEMTQHWDSPVHTPALRWGR